MVIQKWVIYAVLSALFAALVAIFGKIGLKNIDSTLATTIRALVMFALLFLIILFQNKLFLLNKIGFNAYLFIILAGIAGALSWLFFFLALKIGETTKVVSIDRLSLVFVMVFALLLLGEKYSLKALIGIILIIVGSLLVII